MYIGSGFIAMDMPKSRDMFNLLFCLCFFFFLTEKIQMLSVIIFLQEKKKRYAY